MAKREEMSCQPNISVVVPLGPRRSGRVAFKSLLVLNVIAEVVVVLDGGAPSAVLEQLKAHAPTTVVESGGRGAAAARNTGVSSAARGSYLWFLDDDDAALPSADGNIRDALSRMPNCGAWAFSALLRSRPGERKSARVCCDEVKLTQLSCRNMLGGCSSMLVQREVFEEVGGFDSSFESMQDWDIYLRIARKTKIGRYTAPLVIYDDVGENRISSDPKKKRAGLVRLLAKHRAYFDSKTIDLHETRIRYYDCLLGQARLLNLLAAPHRTAALYYTALLLRRRLCDRLPNRISAQ